MSDDLRELMKVLIPLVKMKYPGVDDDRLREIFKDVMADAIANDIATPDSIITALNKRVNEELRS